MDKDIKEGTKIKTICIEIGVILPRILPQKLWLYRLLQAIIGEVLNNI